MIILMMVNCILAQTWTTTSAPNIYCNLIASSADGTKLALTSAQVDFHPFITYDSAIFVSTNSGSNWTQTSASTNEAWIGIASSVDGAKLIAVSGYGGSIYVSADSGTTWTMTSAPKTNWFAVASSADGNKLVATISQGYGFGSVGRIYFSTNSGTAWTQSSSPDANWYSVASSADGTKLVAAGDGGAIETPSGIGWIYTSTNSGATWMQTCGPSNNWIAVASSADGNKLAAAAVEDFQNNLTTGEIYISTNSGNTWTQANVANENWASIVSSADGTKLAALAGASGRVYVSTNSGVVWTLANAPSVSWESAALSADGNKLAAVVSGGLISTVYSTPSPQLNLAPTNNNLMLFWLVPSTNFMIQQSSDLQNWMNITITPLLNLTNLQEQVILSPTNGHTFYRLKTP